MQANCNTRSTKKIWPRYVALGLLVVGAVLGAYFLGPGREEPETIVQAFDATTGDRILNPFALEIEGGKVEDGRSTQHRITEIDPKKFAIKSVDAVGFERDFTDKHSEPTESGSLVKLKLTRVLNAGPSNSLSYVDSIQPIEPMLQGRWPSSEDQRKHLESLKNKLIPASDVTLIVKNNMKNCHLDLLLYWPAPPLINIETANPGNLIADAFRVPQWTYVGTVPPGGSLPFSDFSLEPGFFAFYGSTNGMQAQLLSCNLDDVLYQAPYAIATIYELSEKGFSLKFSQSPP